MRDKKMPFFFSQSRKEEEYYCKIKYIRNLKGSEKMREGKEKLCQI